MYSVSSQGILEAFVSGEIYIAMPIGHPVAVSLYVRCTSLSLMSCSTRRVSHDYVSKLCIPSLSGTCLTTSLVEGPLFLVFLSPTSLLFHRL